MVEQRWCRPQGQSTHLDNVFWDAEGTAYLTLVVREVVWRPPRRAFSWEDVPWKARLRCCMPAGVGQREGHSQQHSGVDVLID